MEVSDEELFDGSVETIKVEAVEEPKPEVVEEEPKGEKQEAEAEAEVKQEEPAQESSPDPEVSQVPISVVHGERDRRQAAEAKLKDLEAKLAETEKKEPTSIFEDEGTARKEILAEVRQERLTENLAMTERFARRLHGDEKVDTAITWFTESAPNSPLLQQKFHESGNDVDEIVSLHKAHLEVEALKDIPNAKAQLKEEVKAEVRAEVLKELEDKDKLKAAVPESLVGDSSEGGLTSQGWGGPPSDEDLFDSA